MTLATIHFSFLTANWIGQVFIIAVGVFVGCMVWGMLEVNILSTRSKRHEREVLAHLAYLSAQAERLAGRD